MRSEKITFKGAFGDQLAARVDQPEDKTKSYALFAHCFTCSKNFKIIKTLSKTLTTHGIGVFRFDFTGLGESEGDFANTNFSSNVDDLIAASEYMESHLQSPAVLIGHSLGGAAMIQAASRIASSKAVATIAAPSSPNSIKEKFGAKLDTIKTEGKATVTLAGRDFTIKKQFLDDLDKNNMDEKIKNLDRPLMVFHSPVDNIVGIDNAAHIYKIARHPKSFVSLDDADHLLSNEEDGIFVAEIIAAWADRYF
ncbi:alpha/beta hydrolase family protein [Fodinibius sp. AD559]|uniref:alpha/beta hydrolase family protein n=1 Tax=Fodinibius sp. AD559 TaxID=3424179 RepID=UPI004046F981